MDLPVFSRDEIRYFPPVGTGKVEEWVEQGWDPDEAKRYLDAYYKICRCQCRNVSAHSGRAEYWHELDVRVSAVLAGQTQRKLRSMIALSLERITERYGGKEKKLYAESFA